MHRKGILVIMGIVFFGAEAVSQHLSHQVLVPAAGVAAGVGISYSQTMGEAVVEIVGSYDHILTQGFQQPRIKLMTGTPPQGTGIKVYPNPAIDYINVELFGESSKSFMISIINVSGVTVYSDEIVFTDRYWEVREIQVAGFARGFYFVRVISTDRAINRSFKFEKM
jgi:hypothetical protein